MNTSFKIGDWVKIKDKSLFYYCGITPEKLFEICNVFSEEVIFLKGIAGYLRKDQIEFYNPIDPPVNTTLITNTAIFKIGETVKVKNISERTYDNAIYFLHPMKECIAKSFKIKEIAYNGNISLDWNYPDYYFSPNWLEKMTDEPEITANKFNVGDWVVNCGGPFNKPIKIKKITNFFKECSKLTFEDYSGEWNQELYKLYSPKIEDYVITSINKTPHKIIEILVRCVKVDDGKIVDFRDIEKFMSKEKYKKLNPKVQEVKKEPKFKVGDTVIVKNIAVNSISNNTAFLPVKKTFIGKNWKIKEISPRGNYLLSDDMNGWYFASDWLELANEPEIHTINENCFGIDFSQATKLPKFKIGDWVIECGTNDKFKVLGVDEFGFLLIKGRLARWNQNSVELYTPKKGDYVKLNIPLSIYSIGHIFEIKEVVDNRFRVEISTFLSQSYIEEFVNKQEFDKQQKLKRSYLKFFLGFVKE